MILNLVNSSNKPWKVCCDKRRGSSCCPRPSTCWASSCWPWTSGSPARCGSGSWCPTTGTAARRGRAPTPTWTPCASSSGPRATLGQARDLRGIQRHCSAGCLYPNLWSTRSVLWMRFVYSHMTFAVAWQTEVRWPLPPPVPLPRDSREEHSPCISGSHASGYSLLCARDTQTRNCFHERNCWQGWIIK